MIIDPFHAALYKVLTEKLLSRVNELATGSARTIMGSGATVAENYAAQTSYIHALQEVMGFCEEVEQEMYGKRESKPQEE